MEAGPEGLTGQPRQQPVDVVHGPITPSAAPPAVEPDPLRCSVTASESIPYRPLGDQSAPVDRATVLDGGRVTGPAGNALDPMDEADQRLPRGGDVAIGAGDRATVPRLAAEVISG